jgi:hypothetical protein
MLNDKAMTDISWFLLNHPLLGKAFFFTNAGKRKIIRVFLFLESSGFSPVSLQQQ